MEETLDSTLEILDWIMEIGAGTLMVVGTAFEEEVVALEDEELAFEVEELALDDDEEDLRTVA